MQVLGDLGHLFHVAAPPVIWGNELQIVDVDDLVPPRQGQGLNIHHGEAARLDNLQLTAYHGTAAVLNFPPVRVLEGMLFEAAEVYPAHGGDGTVHDLVRVGLQGKVPNPLVSGLGPGQLERQRCLARAGIAAQHHKVAVLAPEGAIHLLHPPGNQVGGLALALVEV